MQDQVQETLEQKRQRKIAAGICVTGMTGEVLYVPTDKGELFHAADAPYVLTHGGRNSGKSTMLRWDAHMRNLTIPGHKALLLRRTFPQLRNSHFGQTSLEVKKLFDGSLHQTKFSVEYPNGSLLQFGHCQDMRAVEDYLSQEWDWIGFDELTTFTYDMFQRISASCRVPITVNRKAYVRGATNPIGEGAGWVKRYFIDKRVDWEENDAYTPADWVDIPANMDDNDYADRAEYEKRLNMLGGKDSVLRRAYRDGEWLIEGQFFNEWKEKMDIAGEGQERKVVPWHVIPELPPVETREGLKPIWEVPWVEVTRAIDWGYSEMQPGWCGWFVHLPDGTAICFKEWVFHSRVPEKVAEGILERSRGMKVRYTTGDPVMWWQRSGESIAETMRKKGVWMIEADNERENGWVRLHSWLCLTHDDGRGPRPMLQFLAATGTGMGCPYAIRTIPSLQTDPKKPRDCSQGEGVEDHAADAVRYWAMSRPAPSREPVRSIHNMNLHPEMKKIMLSALTGEEDFLGSESTRRGR